MPCCRKLVCRARNASCPARAPSPRPGRATKATCRAGVAHKRVPCCHTVHAAALRRGRRHCVGGGPSSCPHGGKQFRAQRLFVHTGCAGKVATLCSLRSCRQGGASGRACPPHAVTQAPWQSRTSPWRCYVFWACVLHVRLGRRSPATHTEQTGTMGRPAARRLLVAAFAACTAAAVALTPGTQRFYDDMRALTQYEGNDLQECCGASVDANGDIIKMFVCAAHMCTMHLCFRTVPMLLSMPQ